MAEERRLVLQDWVENEMFNGRYVFTKDMVNSVGFAVSEQTLENSLARLSAKGIIMSPWQNFYVIVPIEYRLKGVVPPSFYIDRLISFIGREYYVALLTAAELNGASHQRSMVFQVMINGGSVRSSVKNGVKLEFSRRQNMPIAFLSKVKTKMGTMNVSGPELTALDCVANERKIGGMSRVAEVTAELSESMQWTDDKLGLLGYFSAAVIQRLGYLLDMLEETALADGLFALLKQSSKQIRKVPLKQSAAVSDGSEPVGRWKIIENCNIEIDEL